MPTVTFQIIDGVDKGRIFRDLEVPVSIGREEGNTLRLNDERVSRFHAKVQLDQDDLILTDLESTNGTKVNGHLIQIHRLRHGDCIAIGRSVLLFGSNEEIAARLTHMRLPNAPDVTAMGDDPEERRRTTQMVAALDAPLDDDDLLFDVKDEEVRITSNGLFIGNREFPPLPQKMTPSQAARLAEILELLHSGLAHTLDQVTEIDEGKEVRLDFATWQKLLSLQMLLARYHRAVTEPDSWQP